MKCSLPSNSDPISSHFVSENLSIKCLKLQLFCESKTWFFVLREMPNLTLSENKLPRRNYDREREEVTGGCRKCKIKNCINFALKNYKDDQIEEY